jgi:uncharacterized protein
LLAYGISWLAWLPYVLSQNGLGMLHLRFPDVLGSSQTLGMLPGAYLGPLASAFLVTAIAEGSPGLRTWRGRLRRWRAGWPWYAFALVGVPALLVLGTLPLPGSVAGVHVPPPAVLVGYLPFLALQVLTTGVAEEPGWRDFALPRLQRSHGPLAGTLILGPLWAGWHLPLFLSEWGDGTGPLEIGEFAIMAVAFSVVITWVFNRTRESLPLAMLIHATVNNVFSLVWPAAFPTLSVRDSITAPVIAFGALAVALIVATRGRLGYEAPVEAGRREQLSGAVGS